MRKKKVIGFLTISVALTALFGLAACGQNGGTDGNTQHVHDMVHHAATATCTAAGDIEFWYCNGCEKYFADEAGTHEVTELSVSALGHDYNADNRCSRCGVIWDYTAGLEYSLNSDGQSYAVSGIGTASGDIVLPVYYEGKPVTSIGERAFYECSGLTKIKIPASVTSIGSAAFAYCRNLTSITIPDSVTDMEEYAFYNCSGLTSVSLPSSVTSIANSAFRGCSGLRSFTIPDGITTIEADAFRVCSGLKEVTIPNSVTSMGNGVFYECSALTGIAIPETMTSIGKWAFAFCSGLKGITIPASVTSIGIYPFAGCGGLESITVEKNNPNYHSNGNCLIETASKTLMAGCQNSVIPTDGSVTRIEGYAFSYCGGITSVSIPDAVTSIGSYAFFQCYSLSSITIPDSVNSIGRDVFWFTAFFNNKNNWENNVLYIGRHLIVVNSKISGEYRIKNGTKTVAAYAFSDCGGLTSIVIPDSVTGMGEHAFQDCSGATIYCEAENEPSEWDSAWNSSDCPVVWGYRSEE